MALTLERCGKAHPYWLSTIQEILLPELPLGNLSPSYQHQLRAAVDALQQNRASDATKLLPTVTEILGAAHPFLLAFQAVLQCKLGHVASAVDLMSKAAIAAPHDARILYSLGLLELKERNFDKAVSNLNQAITLNPNLGAAWAALCLIYALEQLHELTETAARNAIRLGKMLPGNLVPLALMQATQALKKPIEGACDFASLSTNGAQSVHDLLQQLPFVDPESLKHSARSELIVFIYADHLYALEYALPLIWSIAESGTKCAIHLHVANPGRGLAAVLRSIRAALKDIALVVSTESVFVEQIATPSVYHSCVRFCRFYQVMRENRVHGIMLDADMLVRKDLGALVSGCQSDIGLCHSQWDPFWGRFPAAFLYVKPSVAALGYLAQVSTFILDNLAKGTGRWFLDQIALSACFDKLQGRVQFELVSQDICSDLSHKETSAIWAVVNEQKIADNLHNRYKQQLKNKFGYDKLAPREKWTIELVTTPLGKMFINAHDVYIGRNIKHTGYWCKHEIDLLLSITRPGHTIVDGGANIGSLTLPMAQAVGDHGRVFAFEPQRLVHQMLGGNLALNGIKNVFCFQKGLASKPGTMQVGEPAQPDNFGGVSLASADTGPGETAEVMTLDSLALDACHLIKLDIEGMELDALQGAVNTIRRHRPFMYLENHEGEHYHDLIRFVHDFGYRMFWHGVETLNPNMLCVPQESRIQVNGLKAVAVP